MRNIFKIAILLIFSIYNLYGDSKFLYPVYSVKLDKISLETIKMLIIHEDETSFSKGWDVPKDFIYTINLNNLLLLHKKTDEDLKK